MSWASDATPSRFHHTCFYIYIHTIYIYVYVYMYVCVYIYIYTCLRVYMYIHNVSVRYLLVYVCFSDYFCVCFFSNTMKPFILSRNPCALKSIPDKETHKRSLGLSVIDAWSFFKQRGGHIQKVLASVIGDTSPNHNGSSCYRILTFYYISTFDPLGHQVWS